MNINYDCCYVTIIHNNMYTNEKTTVWCPYPKESKACSLSDIISHAHSNIHDFKINTPFRVYLKNDSTPQWCYINPKRSGANYYINAETEVMIVTGPPNCYLAWCNILYQDDNIQYLIFGDQFLAMFNFELMCTQYYSMKYREIQIARIDIFSKDTMRIEEFYINERILVNEAQKKFDNRLDIARNSLNMTVPQWRARYHIFSPTISTTRSSATADPDTSTNEDGDTEDT